LGRQPLANNLPTAIDKNCIKIPLTLMRCNKCGLIQIKETVQPMKIFEEYLYLSSYSKALLQNAEKLVAKVVKKYKLNTETFVVEIGSNDGYLLQYYQKLGIGILGVEPASNIAEYANNVKSIPTLNKFFNIETANEILSKYKKARIVHANNVMAHVAELHSILDGVKKILTHDGIFIVEVAYVKNMLNNAAFDSIYHEHLCYYSIKTINSLFKLHGLEIFDVEIINSHGGSLRVYASHKSVCKKTSRYKKLEIAELENGVNTKKICLSFEKNVNEFRNELYITLSKIKSGNKNIICYGAPAKATVLFNFLKLNSKTIDYVVDNNHLKQSRYIPGTDIFITSPEIINTQKPDYIFISAWNLAEEILNDLKSYKNGGGKFIIPLPRLRII